MNAKQLRELHLPDIQPGSGIPDLFSAYRHLSTGGAARIPVKGQHPYMRQTKLWLSGRKACP